MANIHTITDFSSPELELYARLKENQLHHYFEPAPGLFIAGKLLPAVVMSRYIPLLLITERQRFCMGMCFATSFCVRF